MTDRQPYLYIDNDSQLRQFCQRMKDFKLIAFDTEFVAEDSYWPHLCLIQVAADNEIVIIDPVNGLETGSFWESLCEGNHTTVAHAAREEFLFCWRHVQKRPANLVDVQLAAGFIGYEYPASYGNLVSKVTGIRVDKGETRTDWRRRPLSSRQIDYAIQDVVFLEQIAHTLLEELEKLNRIDWFREEMDLYQDHLALFDNSDRWRRVSGISGLRPRELAIVRSVWNWREEQAKLRNAPPRRILRDDLVLELAKRGSSKASEIRSLRGMNHRQLLKQIDNIAEAIEEALQLPKDQLPRSGKPQATPNLGILGQILTVALSAICRKSNIAPQLVGTAQDVREWAAHKLGIHQPQRPPALSFGWRAKIIGKQLEEILLGKSALRIDNPLADIPLSIVSD
jgi:ribonuclease D